MEKHDIFKAWQIIAEKYNIDTSRKRINVMTRAAFSNAALKLDYKPEVIGKTFGKDRTTVMHYEREHKANMCKLANGKWRPFYYEVYLKAYGIIVPYIEDTEVKDDSYTSLVEERAKAVKKMRELEIDLKYWKNKYYNERKKNTYYKSVMQDPVKLHNSNIRKAV